MTEDRRSGGRSRANVKRGATLSGRVGNRATRSAPGSDADVEMGLGAIYPKTWPPRTDPFPLE